MSNIYGATGLSNKEIFKRIKNFNEIIVGDSIFSPADMMGSVNLFADKLNRVSIKEVVELLKRSNIEVTIGTQSFNNILSAIDELNLGSFSEYSDNMQLCYSHLFNKEIEIIDIYDALEERIRKAVISMYERNREDLRSKFVKNMLTKEQQDLYFKTIDQAISSNNMEVAEQLEEIMRDFITNKLMSLLMSNSLLSLNEYNELVNCHDYSSFDPYLDQISPGEVSF